MHEDCLLPCPAALAPSEACAATFFPADLMNKLGVYLRSRQLAPDVQLKRFIQTRCHGRVVVHDRWARRGAATGDGEFAHMHLECMWCTCVRQRLKIKHLKIKSAC